MQNTATLCNSIGAFNRIAVSFKVHNNKIRRTGVDTANSNMEEKRGSMPHPNTNNVNGGIGQENEEGNNHWSLDEVPEEFRDLFKELIAEGFPESGGESEYYGGDYEFDYDEDIDPERSNYKYSSVRFRAMICKY